MIDLRSDTITQPSDAMRQAMANAPVGDDVYGEDPTVNRLETLAAELLGKEAALFVPSGVMANQLSIRLHTRPGDEVIVESTAHIIRFEGGSASSLSGVQLCCVPGDRGLLTPEQVVTAIRPHDLHNPPTTLLCLEQTHNSGGGSIYPLNTIQQLAKKARAFGLALHLDGARLFHAVIATGVSAAEYAGYFDTATFCLSKGLGAPVGSMIVSDISRIAQLRRLRKVFGGGMRQAGILAAAGIYALEHNMARLKEDHEHAKSLAHRLHAVPNVTVDPDLVETNMIVFHVHDSTRSTNELLRDCQTGGVRMNAVGDHTFRAVTHLDVTTQDIEKAGEILAQVCTR